MLDVAAMLAVVAVVGGYVVRADFATYSVFTVGVFKRLDRAAADGGQECVECESEFQSGERRRYYKEIVVAGMPTVRYAVGESYYCGDHTSFEFRQGEGSGDVRRLSDTLTEAGVQFAVWFFDGEWDVAGQDSEFADYDGNITSDVQAAAGLLPMAVMVLTAAVLVNLFTFGE